MKITLQKDAHRRVLFDEKGVPQDLGCGDGWPDPIRITRFTSESGSIDGVLGR
jgi:hypothetical protein